MNDVDIILYLWYISCCRHGAELVGGSSEIYNNSRVQSKGIISESAITLVKKFQAKKSTMKTFTRRDPTKNRLYIKKQDQLLESKTVLFPKMENRR